MEEESKTKFSMNVEFSFAFKTFCTFFIFCLLFPIQYIILMHVERMLSTTPY